jgi:flagellar FliL protein
MMKLLVPILLVINIALSGAVLGLSLTGGLVVAMPTEGPPEPPGNMGATQAFYYELKPELVVNFPGNTRPRYLQVAITAVTGSEEALAALELHSPAIRNDLLLHFTGSEPGTMATREGKEALRADALQVIQDVMKQRFGSKAVEDVFFTRLVLQ